MVSFHVKTAGFHVKIKQSCIIARDDFIALSSPECASGEPLQYYG